MQVVKLKKVESGNSGDLIIVVIEVDDSHKHENTSARRVQEKLDCGIDAPRSAPDAYEQEHGYEHKLPEDEEDDKVQRYKGAYHRCFKKKHAYQKCLDIFLDIRP